jgi:hypothetical protein
MRRPLRPLRHVTAWQAPSSRQRAGGHAPAARHGRRTALCAGPGRLCEALGITGAHNGLALDAPPFELFARTGRGEIVTGPRIGITKAADKPWRYGLKGSRFLSKPFKPASLKAGSKPSSLAGLFDCDGAVVLGNVVDARRPARDGEERRMRCGIDVQRRPGVRRVPGAGAVEPPVPQHDAFNAGRIERRHFPARAPRGR